MPGDKLDPNGLFERVRAPDGSTYEQIPVAIYDSTPLIPPGGTFTFNFSGEYNPSGEHLSRLVESEILARLLGQHWGRDFLLRTLGLNPEASWCLLEEPRNRLLPDHRDGKPGDFDLIAGPITEGRVSFEEISEIEVKVRKIEADGHPKSFSTGLDQASGAASIGFDRVLLLHILVGEERAEAPGDSPTWRSIRNADFLRPMKATVGMIQKVEQDKPAPYGYALLGWGQIPGVDPLLSGGASPVLARPAPLRPLIHRTDVSVRRQALEKGLHQLLGTRRPGKPLFRRCKKCGVLFSPATSSLMRCC